MNLVRLYHARRYGALGPGASNGRIANGSDAPGDYEELSFDYGTGVAKRSVIVLTALAEKDLKNLTEARVFAVIRKPFDINLLVTKIAESLAATAPR